MTTPRPSAQRASADADQPADARSTLSPGELASVCARYDLGEITRVYAFNRGSRQSPKAIVETDRGRYLVKRRARGGDDPSRVALSHDLQLFLHAKGFPTPAIIGTRHGNNSMTQIGARVYEVFTFVEGEGFDRTPGPCEDAGRQLRALHLHVRDYTPKWPVPAWSRAQPERTMRELGTIARRGLAPRDTRQLADRLARINADTAGETLRATEAQMLHGDWHPGNMVFHGNTVAAVLDFDAARLGPRLLDIASGSLQFSMTRVGLDPASWPDGLDAHRFAAFLRGYGPDAGAAGLAALPATMAGALIAEVAAPVASTGTFAGRDAAPFLRMVLRKADWLLNNAPKLVALAERAAGEGEAEAEG